MKVIISALAMFQGSHGFKSDEQALTKANCLMGMEDKVLEYWLDWKVNAISLQYQLGSNQENTIHLFQQRDLNVENGSL